MPPANSVSPEFLALAPFAEIAASLCEAIATGRWAGPRDLRLICTSAGLPLTQQGLLERVLVAGSKVGFCRENAPLVWEPTTSKEAIGHLSDMLMGAAAYRKQIHRDTDEVDVVLTRPPQPSQLEQALHASGYSYFGLENTGDVFQDMAARAVSRFVVMSPFVDSVGATTLLKLFEGVKEGVRPELIVRYKDAATPPDGLVLITEQLKEHGVRIYNYRLEKGEAGGYETFHAKVVLVDDIWCYVGSANMTHSSFAYSMELGVTVRGEAAMRIGNVIDAIIQVAKRVM